MDDRRGVALATAFAPGKLILLGEHAVVYGRAAVAVPVRAVGASAAVWPSEAPLTVLSRISGEHEGREWPVALAAAPGESPLAAAARATLVRLQAWELPCWRVDVTSSVPVARGLGSSAAVAVAIVRAVSRALGAELSGEEVSGLAFEAERLTHGTPSGIDNTVVALDRPIRFAAGTGAPLAVGAPFRFVIADSGQRAPTREVVAGVRERRDRDPRAHDGWFDEIDALATAAAAALANGDAATLGSLMTDNQRLLRLLGVSTDVLDRIVAAARSAGALGAKLSGAGGGGVAVALVKPDDSAAVAAAMIAAGASSTIASTVT